MKTIINAILPFVMVMTMASCNVFTAKPTETPTPTATSFPASTPTPEPTITPSRIPTETPAAPVLPMPSGKPVANWEGLPVMPKAIAGDGDSTSYSFTVNALPDEVQAFYEREMAKLGWDLLASGQGTTGAFLLIFTQGQETASVSIIPQPDGLIYVMLVK